VCRCLLDLLWAALGASSVAGIGCNDGRPPIGATAPARTPASASSRSAPVLASAAPSALSDPAIVPSSGAEAADAGPKLAVLGAEAPLISLPVDGYGSAVVSLPLGASGPRPVLVATHGNYDRPEWQCQEWRQVVENRAFVLCPRGYARSDSPGPDDVRFTYANNQALGSELDAALAALQARFGAHVDRGPLVYTGFSLGATMGVAIATRAPARQPVLVLVEGGSEWTWGRAKAFAAGGGRRVLFACSQKGCTVAARQAASKLEAVKVGTRIVEKGGLGHSYGGPLNDPIREALPWLLEGDERWLTSAR